MCVCSVNFYINSHRFRFSRTAAFFFQFDFVWLRVPLVQVLFRLSKMFVAWSVQFHAQFRRCWTSASRCPFGPVRPRSQLTHSTLALLKNLLIVFAVKFPVVICTVIYICCCTYHVWLNFVSVSYILEGGRPGRNGPFLVGVFAHKGSWSFEHKLRKPITVPCLKRIFRLANCNLHTLQ